MTGTDVLALLPLGILAFTALLILLAIAWRRRHLPVYVLTCLGFVAALLSLLVAEPPYTIMALLVVDAHALFYMALLLLVALAVTVLAYDYLQDRESPPEEFYLLLLLGTLGALVLVMSVHLVSFFLGLELLSVTLYALLAYLRMDGRPLEAALKYFLLAAAASAFLLFGMACLYAACGSMEFAHIARQLAEPGTTMHWLALSGVAMTLIGIGFKLAVVPFHTWTPDVYEGAPALTTAFIATVSKGAMVALLLRYTTQLGLSTFLVLLFSLIAVASMTLGNGLALWQQNVKRLLAYSSIAHFGYMLVALVVAGARGVEAATYYLLAYIVTILIAFGCITVLSGNRAEAENLEDYRGLFWRRPAVAAFLALALLSLAGMPLTGGFVGKLYVVAAGVSATLWTLVFFVILNSAIGLFYYLRVLVVMLDTAPRQEASLSVPASWSWTSGTVLAVLTAMLVWLGVYPPPFITIIRATVASLF